MGSDKMSWEECQRDPRCCKTGCRTNKFDYPAYFALMNLAGQIDGLGWGTGRTEVTFEPVSCDRFDGPTWDCESGAFKLRCSSLRAATLIFADRVHKGSLSNALVFF